MVAGAAVPFRATPFLGTLCQPGTRSGREKSPVLSTRPLDRDPFAVANPHEEQVGELVGLRCFDFDHPDRLGLSTAEEIPQLSLHYQGREDAEE